MGNQAGDSGVHAVDPANVADSGHCSIAVFEFFLRAVITCRDPGDFGSWLSGSSLADSHSALVRGQSHCRRDYRRKKTTVVNSSSGQSFHLRNRIGGIF